MGLGGHLLWSSVVRRLHEDSGNPVRVSYLPGLTDLLRGKLHDVSRSVRNDMIFRDNPRIDSQQIKKKPRVFIAFDKAVITALRLLGLLGLYERFIFWVVCLVRHRSGIWYAHIDMSLHSYMARETPDRMVWKEGGHIIDILLANYGLIARDYQCEMYFSSNEKAAVDRLQESLKLSAAFVVIEPHSNSQWFGDLREWPFERWERVVEWVRDQNYPVVQIGEGGSSVLGGAIDITGRTSFREAVLLMQRARLFLGQEGGLMHAANAVNVPSVIVWGGLTLPEFAGYRKHTVLCTRVDCAPCGFLGNCPYDKKCLTSIEPSDVISAVSGMLASSKTEIV
jgi:hypothetical protein